jgi:hypothetical protein
MVLLDAVVNGKQNIALTSGKRTIVSGNFVAVTRFLRFRHDQKR